MKRAFVKSGICLVCFLLLVFCLGRVDVKAIGPNGTEVGLSSLNSAFHAWTGESAFWYELSEALGAVPILIAAGFAGLGLFQLIRRNSLLRVDREIIVLGAVYALLFALYVLFGVIVVNRRPILMAGETEPEPSFPSSHTMMFLVFLGSFWIFFRRRILQPAARLGVLAGIYLFAIFSVAARLLSGAHWLTDIVGGVLLSGVLLFTLDGLFCAFCGGEK